MKLLGADQPVVLKIMDRLGGAALTAASAGTLDALAFFAVRDELVKWGNDVVGGIRGKISGLNRFDRTQRLVAAHAVIVITSFYEALDRALTAPQPAGLGSLRLTRAEQISLATDSPVAGGYSTLVGALLDSPVPMPEPQRPYEATLSHLSDFWGTAYGRITQFIEQLSGWKDLTPSEREMLGGHLGGMHSRTVRRYEENYRRLATEVPEFAVWTNLTDHQATRAAVRRYGDELRDRIAAVSTGLQGMPDILAWVSGHAAADQTRADLALRYRAAIGSSVLSGADAPEGVSLPSLQNLYINPNCRVAFIGKDALPANDHWWESERPVCDVQWALSGLLTCPQAVEAPLVILGQPGAGKSVLTKMLSARLIDGGFLPVLVELRSVPAGAPVQAQIEHAVRDLTGRDARWPELAGAFGDLPVVLLDGFDELLQATGVNRTDYLEQVADFQRREYELGRPTAVIVTSRTVVADRVRFPQGTAALKLEPLNEVQIETWLRVWNEANAPGFAARGVQALPVATALAHSELASQPLLLLMLALYDARSNALQAAPADLSRAELYEQLLDDFIGREVRKHHPGLDLAGEQREIAAEMRRLSITALAMFNRHSQVVTEMQLNADMSVLVPAPPNPKDSGFRKPLTAAQLLIGRFFFIHESQALRDSNNTNEHAFEFLHATFGEFLVAWLAVATLIDLADERAFNARRVAAPCVDDSFLWATLSFASLTGRDPIIEFTDGLLTRLPRTRRAAVHDVIKDLLCNALFPQPRRSFDNYEPQRRRAAYRYAAYSCNLAILAVLSADGPLPMTSWDTGLWWSQLTALEWHGLRDTVRVRRIFDPETLRLELWAAREDGTPLDPVGTVLPFPYNPAKPQTFPSGYVYDAEVPPDSEGGQKLRTAAFFLNVLDAPGGLSEVLIPYYRHIGSGTGHLAEDLSDLPATPAAAILKLRLGACTPGKVEPRMQLYRWCFSVTRALDNTNGWLTALYRQLREDAPVLGPDKISDLLLFAAEQDTVEVREFLDVLSTIGSQESQPVVTNLLLALRKFMVNSATLFFDESDLRRARELFVRYNISDPFETA
ncbi:MAG TPA: hypothetical protein VF070_37810 [Streptosporangiaceae bacterium]